jgi:hypothetical protein
MFGKEETRMRKGLVLFAALLVIAACKDSTEPDSTHTAQPETRSTPVAPAAPAATAAVAVAHPFCNGTWYGYLDADSHSLKPNRNSDLRLNCRGNFKRVAKPSESSCKGSGPPDPTQPSCLCEAQGLVCQTVCDFEGNHNEAWCGVPGKDGKGDHTRIVCCS